MRINRAAIAAICVVIILCPVGYSVLSAVFSQGSEPFLEKPEKADQCVRDTTYMRFHHMDLLRDRRNEAVREGMRGDIGITTCRECHTSRERFCNQCHDAVNLDLDRDCFRCHYYP